MPYPYGTNRKPRIAMTWIVALNVGVLLGIAAFLAARFNPGRDGPPARVMPSSRVSHALPQVEKVDIRALFDKWSD
jgi:hypothetical protein